LTTVADTSHIWSVPAYLPYLQPALTPAAIEEAEHQLGITLPASYLELLRLQNGGYVRFTLPGTVHSMIWGIGPHFPSITEEHDWQAESAAEEEGWAWVPRSAHRLVPFDGDGHWYLCFDYRSAGPQQQPRISLIDLELETETEVAASFEVFLSMLEEAMDLGTLGIIQSSFEFIVEVLERELHVTFEPPDSWDHGYPVRRARIPAAEPEWVWMSPNRVARGFARPSEPRYAELRDLLPGTALRLPHLAEVETILQCTAGVMSMVRDACDRAALRSIEIRPLKYREVPKEKRL
jgi:hypothetical protein